MCIISPVVILQSFVAPQAIHNDFPGLSALLLLVFIGSISTILLDYSCIAVTKSLMGRLMLIVSEGSVYSILPSCSQLKHHGGETVWQRQAFTCGTQGAENKENRKLKLDNMTPRIYCQ